MSRIIEIDGGLVTVINRTVETSVPLDEWVAGIERRSPTMMPTLPVGTRAAFFDPSGPTQTLQILIEREPHIIRMGFRDIVHELSLPYVRFFFYASTTNPDNNAEWALMDYRVFFAKEPYGDPANLDMIPALLPNVYPDGRICFGSTAADAAQTLARRLDQTVNEFFLSRFNGDLTIRRPNRAGSYRPWLTMTRIDPTGWMNWLDWTDRVNHSFFSFNSLAREGRSHERFEPMVAADPIPEVPLGATFGRVNEWLETLDNTQRERLLRAALQMRETSPERFEGGNDAT